MKIRIIAYGYPSLWWVMWKMVQYRTNCTQGEFLARWELWDIDILGRPDIENRTVILVGRKAAKYIRRGTPAYLFPYKDIQNNEYRTIPLPGGSWKEYANKDLADMITLLLAELHNAQT